MSYRKGKFHIKQALDPHPDHPETLPPHHPFTPNTSWQSFV